MTLTEAKKLREGDKVKFTCPSKTFSSLNFGFTNTGVVIERQRPSSKAGTPAVITIEWEGDPHDTDFLTLERGDSDTKYMLERMERVTD